MSCRAAILVSLAGLLVACEKESPSADAAKHVDAGASKASAIDPDLAQAMAAASTRAPAAGPNTAQGGPPPNGIFGPGGADRELPRGAPPKVTLGSDGADPRITLVPVQPKAGSKQSGTIQIVQQSEGGGLPVEFAVTFEAQKSKADAAGGATGVGLPVPVVVKVTGAHVAVAGAPKDLEAAVAKLKGSKVEYEIAADGAGTGYRFEVPKSAGPELADIVRALSDTLAVVTLPYPDKPVGVGAYWMATYRDGVLGLDLVTYRLIKVEKVEGQKVTLNVNTKRYSASPSFDLPGLGPNAPHSLAEFQSISEGSVEVIAGKGFPTGGTQNAALGAQLQDPQNPRARGMLEIRTHAELKF